MDMDDSQPESETTDAVERVTAILESHALRKKSVPTPGQGGRVLLQVNEIVLVGNLPCRVRRITPKDIVLRPLSKVAAAAYFKSRLAKAQRGQ